ncbi:hypothetical protein QUA13_07355 [Microcoleus sp. S28C3]|uniref:hypothetical protein n=1 Tax=Microcoleus sp. S28C3 TaxID=3055414 RepID=UPI002FD48202
MKEKKVSGGTIRQLRYIAFVGAAFFQNNPDLVAWVNSQPQSESITCLGDGHDGVWNLFKQIGTIELSNPHSADIHADLISKKLRIAKTSNDCYAII